MTQKAKIKFVDKDRTTFFATLNKRVDDYFKENKLSRNANTSMVVKTITLMSAYLIPFICILALPISYGMALALWAVMGFSIAGIGMSIMHDGNHGSYSSNPKVNNLVGYSLILLGGSIFNWKLQHNVLHHTYTNILDMDDDIDDKLVLRFSPHTNVRWYHKLQFIYAFFFYGILTIYWVILKDFVQFGKYTKNGVNTNSKQQNFVVLTKIALSKVFYFVLMFGLPYYIGLPFYQILSGWLLMHFIAGLILTTIFQLAHTVEGTTHPLPDANGTIENNWAIHQINTTVNFSRHNKFISWYVGGLNFQVEHHLFPRICHVHYPAIAPIVKQTCEEYGIPYLENETFAGALKSHINTLVRFGKLPDINEAIA